MSFKDRLSIKLGFNITFLIFYIVEIIRNYNLFIYHLWFYIHFRLDTHDEGEIQRNTRPLKGK